jgi:putative endonuclease
MTYQKKIGDFGESLAADYLQRKGYLLLDRQYTTRYGELDLVMQELDTVVFVEVKTRTSSTYGLPEVSITAEKIEKIQNAALLWLQAHPCAPDDWRVDAVAVLLDHQNALRDLQHFANIT